MPTDRELRDGGPPEAFDNTVKSYWCKCPRSLYWFYRGLDYLERPPYFTFGTAWGAGLNVWHQSQGISDLETRINAGLATLRKVWEKDAPPPPAKQSFDTLNNLEHLFLEYVETYGANEPWAHAYEKGELGFVLPIPGTTILFGGAIDSPIRWNPYGIMPREDKTTGFWVNDSYISQWDHSTQVTGYLWAMRQVLGEEPFAAYMNIAGKRPRKDPAERFRRYLAKRDEEEIQSWLRDTILVVDDIRREWDRWLWPKLGAHDPINCAGGAGRKSCLYHRLCLRPMEPWDFEEAYDFSSEFAFREKDWAPWERKGED